MHGCDVMADGPHSQQVSRLSSKGRQQTVQDYGLQETAHYSANAKYKDVFARQTEIKPGPDAK